MTRFAHILAAVGLTAIIGMTAPACDAGADGPTTTTERAQVVLDMDSPAALKVFHVQVTPKTTAHQTMSFDEWVRVELFVFYDVPPGPDPTPAQLEVAIAGHAPQIVEVMGDHRMVFDVQLQGTCHTVDYAAPLHVSLHRIDAADSPMTVDIDVDP